MTVPGCLFIEPGHQVPAQLVEQALGNHRRALDRRLERPKLKDRAPKSAKLLAEQLNAGRAGIGRREGCVAPGSRHSAGGRFTGDQERFARSGSNFDVELCLTCRRTFERPAQPPAQLGIVGLPDPLPFFNREQVDIAASESELEQTGLARTGPCFHRGLARVCPGNDLVDASALLGAPGPFVAVKDHAVARLDGGQGIQSHA